jgi:ABC-type microcin C transport system permease subunit YejB
MLLGEITNPLQNLYYVTQYAMMLACCNGPRMGFANAVVEVLFCGAYLVLRALVMPVAGMHMTYKLATGRAIPSLLKVLYILLIWGVMIGSIPWIQDCWDTLQRRMSSTVSISSEL